MHNFTARCGISRVFSIGRSALGTDLLAMEISNHPGLDEAKPAFKYVGNMHGDEPTGRSAIILTIIVLKCSIMHLLISLNPLNGIASNVSFNPPDTLQSAEVA